MITKGEILSIDYNSNTCSVRLPIFDTVSVAAPTVINAIFSIQPGIYNGYNVGDVVEVGFEDHLVSSGVVLGKLYLGVAKESKNNYSSIYGSALNITDSASIPLSTSLTSTNNSSININSDVTNYKSILDIIKKVQNNDKRISTLEDNNSKNKYIKEEQQIGTWFNNKTVYRTTYYLEKSISSSQQITLGNINIDDLIKVNYQIKTSNNGWVSNSLTYTIDLSGNIKITAPSISNINKIIFIIEYTKN